MTEGNTRAAKPQPAKWTQYVAAIVVNAALIVIANQIVNWDVLTFLTADFNRVLWLINVSLGATILVNALFLFFDPKWFISLCRAVTSSLALVATIRMLQVFPFDFAEYPSFDWALLVRVILIITIVATSITILAELVRAGLAFGRGD